MYLVNSSMRILLIGEPRSRSVFMLYSLSKFFQYSCLDEPFAKAATVNNKKEIESIAENLRLKDNITVKIQTTSFFCNDINSFDIHSYDSVYLTYRDNVNESIASMLIATQQGIWTHTTDHPPVCENDISKIKVDIDNAAHRLIIEHCLQNRYLVKTTQEWAIKNNINCTGIEYNDILDYVENILGVKSHILPNNYNYTTLIENYNDLPTIVREVAMTSNYLI